MNIKTRILLLSLINLGLLISCHGCALTPKLITDEEHQRLPNLRKELEQYRESNNQEIMFWIGKPKTLRNERFHNNVTIYNITKREEIDQIIIIIQQEIKNAPDWYYAEVKFYEKENWICRDNWRARHNEKLIHGQILTPDVKKNKTQQATSPDG